MLHVTSDIGDYITLYYIIQINLYLLFFCQSCYRFVILLVFSENQSFSLTFIMFPVNFIEGGRRTQAQAYF